MTLLFGKYTTLNHRLEIVEAEADKVMGLPDLTSPVYRLLQNQNCCIPSTQLCILALRLE
jgi:hypothetical protein